MGLESRAGLIAAAALALSACGGGGINSTPYVPSPTPSPSPPPTAHLIPQATTSQQFAAIGTSYGDLEHHPLLAAEAQLQIRYVESSDSYQVQIPDTAEWSSIHLQSWGQPVNYGGETAQLWVKSGDYNNAPLGDYQYSTLFQWAQSDGTIWGDEAIGMATPVSAIPVNGSASYLGQLLGGTSEVQDGSDMQIGGSISLAFDFGLGTLSGSISPTLYQDFAGLPLGAIGFRDTVYSKGSSTFAGAFDTNVAGLNSFSGLFTGPGAEELIGNFALPYKSPIDGTEQQASGAFIGRSH